MYEERQSVIPGAVVWQATVTGPARVLPDGCMDLIWMAGDIVVAGPDTCPYEVEGCLGERFVGLRFPPGVLPGLLGVPAAELRNTRVPLHEIARKDRTAVLVERVAETALPGRALEAFASPHVAAAQDSRTPEIVRLLGSGAAMSTVAEQANLGERQLHRWSRRRFGYGPKTLARILRFQSALRLGRQGNAAAVVAAHAGYADQAHLIRETRTLAGASFAQLLGS